MSKGLELFYNLKETLYKIAIIDIKAKDSLDIIEKDLKASEIAIDFINKIADEFDEHDLDELMDKIIKTKKALEIIKNKRPSIIRLRLAENLEHYNLIMIERQKLTQEEYDLLKVVLL